MLTVPINGSVVLGADESPWPCGTPSWYTPLSWTILSEQNNLHLFLSQLICVFSKMSVPLSVPLSVCGQNLVRSVSSTIPGRSISYLYILSTNFRRCVACWVLWKIQKFSMRIPLDSLLNISSGIGCYTHFMTFNFDVDLDLGFSRSNFEKVLSQEWDGRLTWNERDVSR